MSTKAIKPRRDDGPLQSGWDPVAERAPSVVRPDQPLLARYIAVIGLMLAVVGASALAAAWWGRPYLVGPGLGFFCAALGVGGLLLHAFNEKDENYRRMYGVFGGILVAAAVIAAFAPVAEEMGRLFVPLSVPFLFLGLLFLISFARNETDVVLRSVTVRLLGVAGFVMILVALVLSNIGSDFETFLLTRGTLLLILGLLYVAAFVGMQETGGDAGYWAGFALGVLGAVMILIGAIRPFISERFTLVPCGLLLIYLGIEYVLLSVGICSDSTLVVLTRRELGAFFYSPIAYIILVGLTLIGWILFYLFVSRIWAASETMGQPMLEPIVAQYIFAIIPVFCVIFMVPVLTMRLFSEELRSGTLEVLLTAPVKEWQIVVSKFLAALRFFLLAWYPWGLYLLALRVEGGQEFDVRPLLSFYIVLAINGAGFLALGIFFSSLTRSQIAAAVLTFMVLMLMLGLFFLKMQLGQANPWYTVLNYVSFIDLWYMAVEGNLAPRFLLFHLSTCVFWLFLTTKILDARKWA
jgi:ABC-type transport system involved in multi-copper enzyme maturation permease subunit